MSLPLFSILSVVRYTCSHTTSPSCNLTPTTTISLTLLQEQRAYLTAATAKQAARSPMKLPPPRIPVQVPSPPQASAATGSALSSTGGGGGGGAPEEGLLNSADRKTVVEILGRYTHPPTHTHTHTCICKYTCSRTHMYVITAVLSLSSAPHYFPIPPSPSPHLSLILPHHHSLPPSPHHLPTPPHPLSPSSHSSSPSIRAGAISPEQAAALNILIAKGDDRIKRVFTVYEADKDVYKLIDALKIFNIESQVSHAVCVMICYCQWAYLHHSNIAVHLFTGISLKTYL